MHAKLKHIYRERIFDYTFGFITTHYGLYQWLNTQKSLHISGHFQTQCDIACLVAIYLTVFSCILYMYICSKRKFCPIRIEYRIISDGHILIRLISADCIRVLTLLSLFIASVTTDGLPKKKRVGLSMKEFIYVLFFHVSPF